MKKIFLLILILRSVTADEEESYEKYIDLLPDEEKQEFLNRIARRILEEIKSIDTPKDSHADVTDDQLDAHDSYVQDIIKEESQNLETKKRRHGKDGNGDNDQDNTNNENKDEHIDLTLREGKRLKRKNSGDDIQMTTIRELPYDVIPVQTIYDQDVKNDNEVINDSSTLVSSNNNITLIDDNQENSTDKNELITYYSENPVETINFFRNDTTFDTLSNEQEHSNLKKSYENDNIESTIITDFDHDNYESTPVTGDIENISAILQQKNVNNTDNHETRWDSTQNIFLESGSNENNVKTTSSMDYTTTTSETSTSVIDVTSSEIDNYTVTENENVESTTVYYTDNFTHPNAAINTRKKISDNLLRDGINADENTKKIMQLNETETTLSTIIGSTLDENFTTTLNSSTNTYTAVTETSISTSFTKSNDVLTTASPNEELDDLNLKNLARQEKTDDDKVILRGRSGILNENEIDDTNLFHNSDESTQGVYEIYEVDPNKPHFISSGKKRIDEHPYYVPVYNYAPENAYYTTFNKLGPNIKDSEEIEKSFEYLRNSNIRLLNGGHRFSGYNKRKGQSKTRNAKTLNKKRDKTKFMKPISQTLINNDIFYNPYDYPDMDYYFGRILRRDDNDEDVKIDDNDYINYKHFPDSHEPDHPLSSIHTSKTVKDHVRAVRKLLYLQKLFGYIPDKYNKRGRKAYSNSRGSLDNFELSHYMNPGEEKKPQGDGISMDYYFGRIDSNENGAKIRAFSDNRSQFNYMNINPNLLPLTPKPFKFKQIIETKRSKVKKEDVENIEDINSPRGIKIPDKELRAILDVLRDHIRFDNEELVNYNWLQTTVNIQAALRKLLDLTAQLKDGEYIHPKDAELLKYILYLFKYSTISLYGNDIYKDDANVHLDAERVKNTKKSNPFPKSKIKHIIKEPIKLWKEFNTYIRSKDDKVVIKRQAKKLLQYFENFIGSLLFHLNDLHNTVKHISLITNYKDQRWYRDLKDTFLKKANLKNLAQVVLHLSLSRLLDYVEESAKNGMENNFRRYLKENKEDVKRSREETLFVLRVVDVLERINT